MKIKIQEPWWSAYKTFGWAKGIWGVGLSVKEVEKALATKERLEITFSKFSEVYTISPITVKTYALNNKTIFNARGNTQLYVIPQTKLEKVK